jgi:hypothetical protein
MSFLEALRSHRGGLVRLKGELFWYDGRGWDGITGRACLLLNTAAVGVDVAAAARATAAATRATGAVALLLIDGTPHWVWIAPADVELL